MPRRVLIGIPVLNNSEMTRACLHLLERHTQTDAMGLQVSVLVVDNGSREDIAGMLRQEFGAGPLTLYYIRNPINLGVAVAWNQILRFWPRALPEPGFCYDYYVIANNDALVGPDWLQPMIAAMESDARIGWVSALENGSPALPELIQAHDLSKQFRVAPDRPYTTDLILDSMDRIYARWGGHAAFCRMVKHSGLPAFVPFQGAGRSAVCYLIRPAMVAQIGYFDEDYAPVGISEDLEYFLRMERLLTPAWLTEDRYPPHRKWRAGFSGGSVVHHNWCSTHQGPDFDGRKWDKTREKNWRAKFGKSKKHFTRLLP
jgi:GT2 family glycosyltransferase